MKQQEYGLETKEFAEKLKFQKNSKGYADLELCVQAAEYADKIKSPELKGIANYYMALYFLCHSSPEKAVSHVTETIRCLEDTQQAETMAYAYNLLGVIACGQDNSVLALENYILCLNYCRKHGLSHVHGVVCYNMGDMYYRLGDCRQALDYYEDAYQYYCSCGREHDGGRGMRLSRVGMGYCYLRLGDMQAADRIADEFKQIGMEEEPLSRMAVYAFLASVSSANGEMQQAGQAIDIAVSELKNVPVVLANYEVILNIANYLIVSGEYKKLEIVLDYVEPLLAIASNEGILLQFLLMRLRFCSSSISSEEYEKYARQFFRIMERQERENKKVVLQAVKLRASLEKLREKQKEISTQNQRLMKTSLYDEVSGLPNRAYLNREIDRRYMEMNKEGKKFGVEILDIDYFKQYNDCYGHLEGDACIRRVGGVLQSVAEKDVFCARYGGDEFTIIFTDKTDEEILRIQQEICDRMTDNHIVHEDSEAADIVTVTQGAVNKTPERQDRVWDYMAWADKTLYSVKRQGRGGYRLIGEFRLS